MPGERIDVPLALCSPGCWKPMTFAAILLLASAGAIHVVCEILLSAFGRLGRRLKQWRPPAMPFAAFRGGKLCALPCGSETCALREPRQAILSNAST
jgi:hypothetical protein